MIKFSYIVPTICKFPRLEEQLTKIGNTECIDEIIIVNNSGGLQIPQIQTKAPVIEITPKEPSFCNGAWNIGAEAAKNDYIIISTEDLIYDANVLNMIAEQIDKLPNLGVLGMDWNIASDHCPPLQSIWMQEAGTQREYGFGFMMFMKKINFTPIPTGVKQWYGDDFTYYMMLERGLKNYIIKSDSFRIETVAGSMSYSEETKARIESDKIYWRSNYYDKFTKYGTRCG